MTALRGLFYAFLLERETGDGSANRVMDEIDRRSCALAGSPVRLAALPSTAGRIGVE